MRAVSDPLCHTGRGFGGISLLQLAQSLPWDVEFFACVQMMEWECFCSSTNPNFSLSVISEISESIY